MKDNSIHNLIRDKLVDFEVPFEEGHWQQMADKIKLENIDYIKEKGAFNKWRNAGLLFLLILLAGGAYYGLSPRFTDDTKEVKQINFVPVTQMNEDSADQKITLPKAGNDQIDQGNNNETFVADEKSTISVQNVPAIDKVANNAITTAIGLAAHESVKRTEQVSFLRRKPWQVSSDFQPMSATVLLEMQIKSNLVTKKMTEDSATFKIFERNSPNWNNAVVVCDWTTSMFKYGTEVVNWLSAQEDAENIKGFVFFNDCDADGNAVKVSGAQGEMFAVHATNTNKVLEAMIAAVRKGAANRDLQENDAEALKYAVEEFQDIEEIILIADNVSPVRQLGLLKDVNVPVKIVICGATYIPDLPIQPDYIKIASKTGGSIHTVEDDLYELSPIAEDTWIKVGDKFYKYKNGEFKATNRKKRPKNQRTN